MRISDWSSDVCSSDLPSLFTPELRGLIEKFGDEAIDWLGTTGPVIGPFVLVQRDEAGGVRRRRYRTDTPTGIQHVMVSHDHRGPIFEIEIGRASCRERGCQYV